MVRASLPVRWGIRPASTNNLVAVATDDPSASSSRTLAENESPNQRSASTVTTIHYCKGTGNDFVLIYLYTSIICNVVPESGMSSSLM